MDLSRVLVMILAGGKGQRLDPLTRDRPKPAIPFGGIYRIIDFTLSNCLNSDLRKIVTLVQYGSLSLNRHIRDGWNIYFATALGEYIDSVPPQHRAGKSWYLGTADAIQQNIQFIETENPEYVLILAGDHIYKMDYRHMIRFHVEKSADLTVGAVEVRKEDASNFGILAIDNQDRITGFAEKPASPQPTPKNPNICLASMGIYIFKTETMIRVLQEDAKDKQSTHDFGKDIIPRMVGKNKVYAFSFIDENKKEAKYWRDVGTIDAYYNANMDLISVTPMLNLYDSSWPIRTAIVQAPPPKFVFAQEFPGGRIGMALDSLVSPGSIISGGKVQHSVLSPFVRVNSYCEVHDSILFEGVNVGRNARVRNAIIDEGVTIPEGDQIGYDPDKDKARFLVSHDGVVVIPRGQKF